MKVTRDTVFTAAEAILVRGEKPTNEKVRNELGSGSFSDIGPHFREWRDRQSSHSLAIIDIPEDVKQTSTRSGELMWAEASKVAAQRVALAEERVVQIEADRREVEELLEKEIKRLEQLLAKRDAQVVDLQANVSAKEDAIRLLELELSKLKGRSEAALELQSQFKWLNDHIAKADSGEDKNAGRSSPD
ncbi:DNA-binding protein [Endozoicomonas ascidiicola]|uniref:DNA-binding protein n=1 Tax=Endozoicomonas ascidiicola TaxID=1698521 RepID=UPI0008341660|nr:DNA-binding protein [Endozoicomonas ascidiicola]